MILAEPDDLEIGMRVLVEEGAGEYWPGEIVAIEVLETDEDPPRPFVSWDVRMETPDGKPSVLTTMVIDRDHIIHPVPESFRVMPWSDEKKAESAAFWNAVESILLAEGAK